MSERVPPA